MARRKKPDNMLLSSAARPGDSGGTLEDAIRRRAFQLYEARGKGEGCAMEDWLRAEAEVLAHLSNKPVENPLK